MEVYFESSFEKDLEKISKEKRLDTLKIIEEVKLANNLGELRNLKKMRGEDTFYRVKTGKYRIG